MRRISRFLPFPLALLMAACGSEAPLSTELTPWMQDAPGGTDAEGDPLDAMPGDADLPHDPAPADAEVVVPPDGGCSSSDGCPLGSVCIDTACVPGCVMDRDCPDGMHCIPESLPHGFCTECTEDGHCGDGRCVDGQCRARCTVDDDCADVPDAPYCEPLDSVCVGCRIDDDCGLGNVCLGRQCLAGCTSDANCPKPLRCNRVAVEVGTCVECAGDAQCSGGRVCRGQRCVFDCAAIECPFDRPRCVPATGACVECEETAQCDAGRICLSGTCVPGCLVEGDCGAGMHCTGGSTGGSPGQCVACTTESHCTGGARCVGNVCVLQTCATDGDCGAGRYCHPVLKDCHDLPADACATDKDCGLIPGTQIGRNCDPLTRTCIAECLPLKTCAVATRFCIDGSCYGCRANADCPGTRCDPFDRECDRCASDADCTVAGWHCNTATGACMQCVFDADCGTGRRCHPDKHTCVECRIDADCKVATLPVCGKDNRCIAACQDECAAGNGACAAMGGGMMGIRPCGDVDNDPCLDLGPVVACPAGQACVTGPDGSGACGCAGVCTAGDSRCSADAASIEECVLDAVTGCTLWKATACGKGAACTGGACACTGECTYSSRKCDPDKSWITLYCGREGGACNHWIEVDCPFPGYCVEGECRGSNGGN